MNPTYLNHGFARLDPVFTILGQAPRAAFAKMGAATEAAVERLGELLSDGDGSVRLQAAYALSRMGRQSLPARARLIGALEDSSRRVREWAAAALQGLEANSTP
jgi:HEAT repeat protein